MACITSEAGVAAGFVGKPRLLQAKGLSFVMNRFFIDSAYCFDLLSTSDQWHEQASSWAKIVRASYWTTDYVLLEVADGFAKADFRQDALTFIDNLRTRRSTIIIEQSRQLFERGLSLYRRRADKDWSLTDCISFIVMEDNKLRDALTSDHHFEQAGYRALLRHTPPANGS